jgi:hypothetical protein
MATRCFMPPESVVRERVGKGRQAYLFQVMQSALFSFFFAQPARGQQGKHHVVFHRLPRRQLVELLEHHDAVRPGPRTWLALEPDLAFYRRDKARNGLEQRRLAATRCAEQHEAVGLMHLEADLVRGPHHALRGAVFEAHAVDLQQRRAAGSVLRGVTVAMRSAAGLGEGFLEEVVLPRGGAVLQHAELVQFVGIHEGAERRDGEVVLGVFDDACARTRAAVWTSARG